MRRGSTTDASRHARLLQDAVTFGHLGIIILSFSYSPKSGQIWWTKDYNTALTIIRTTFLLFYDKFLQYVTKFATMTSGQRNKSVVHPEQRYAYMPCPLYDTGEWLLSCLERMHCLLRTLHINSYFFVHQ